MYFILKSHFILFLHLNTHSDTPGFFCRENFRWSFFQIYGWKYDERTIDQFCIDSIPEGTRMLIPKIISVDLVHSGSSF